MLDELHTNQLTLLHGYYVHACVRTDVRNTACVGVRASWTVFLGANLSVNTELHATTVLLLYPRVHKHNKSNKILIAWK